MEEWVGSREGEGMEEKGNGRNGKESVDGGMCIYGKVSGEG